MSEEHTPNAISLYGISALNIFSNPEMKLANERK